MSTILNPIRPPSTPTTRETIDREGLAQQARKAKSAQSTTIATNPGYRADIDGLRGIAVLLVVFNHVHTRFTGGYIGVDVFFVISGYLISSVIISDMVKGQFSLISFYERRIRRIVPALFATIAATAFLCYRCFVPSETLAFAWSALASEFSVANLYFLHGSGYFARASELIPLLHTWSLSVEEQFYIFFPLLLIYILRRHPAWLQRSICTLALLSFAFAAFWAYRDATYAFYLAPLRAWELLLGTIVSQRYLPAIRGPLLRNAASLTGLLLVLVPALVYESDTPFPGIAALPPCLGAALIIAAGDSGSSVVGRLLRLRPLTFVGLISYSLYLWHWPILAFQRTSHLLLDAPLQSKQVKLAIITVSFVVACFSWRFIETPFRKGRLRPRRRTLFWLSGVAFSAVGAMAVGIVASGGNASRFSGQALAVSRYRSTDLDQPYRLNQCFLDTTATFNQFTPGICMHDDPTRPQFLLLGDSHAAQMYPGLAATFPEINFSQATVAGCRASTIPRPKSRLNCKQMISYIFNQFLPRHHVDTVLLGGKWEEDDLPDVERTVLWLKQHGMKVVLFGPGIEYDLPLPRILAFSIQNRRPSDVPPHRISTPEWLDQRWAPVFRNQLGIRYISTYEDLCTVIFGNNDGVKAQSAHDCPTLAAPGVPLLFDTDHLTTEASTDFARVIRARGQLP